jgi:hypothetical protein
LFDRYPSQAIINLAAESHVDRSTVRPILFVQISVVRSHYFRSRCVFGAGRTSHHAVYFGSCTCRLTKSKGRSAPTASSPRRRPIGRIRPIRQARLLRTTWCELGGKLMNCRHSSPIARTIMAPISFQRN